ncbi:MAG: EAL domain-containing protein, partial [Planctomycetota bacterium]
MLDETNNPHGCCDSSAEWHPGTISKIESDLVAGIQADEFVLNYQPIFDLSQDQLIGVEALVRWKHPFRGWVFPNQFLKIAELSGVTLPLGQRITRLACQQLSQWQNQFLIPSFFRVHINLSAKQLLDPEFQIMMGKELESEGLHPNQFCLEVSERSLHNELNDTFQILTKLRNLGFHLMIDDFGLGQNSLNYLEDLPIEALKIDRSLIENLGINRCDCVIVRMVCDLAETLHFDTVA